MAAEQVAALVRVRVTRKHQVHAVLLEHRHQVLPQLVALVLGVRVVAALAVRGLVVVGDDPVVVGLLRSRQILLEPSIKSRVVLQSQAIGIHRDKVNGSVVEGVVGRVVGGDAAGLAVPGVGEDVEVRARLLPEVGGRPVVVSWSGEDRHAGVLLLVDLEELLLVFPVFARVVGEVAEAQREVPVAAGEVREGVSHRLGLVVPRSAVANGPHAHGLAKRSAGLRKGPEGEVLGRGDDAGSLVRHRRRRVLFISLVLRLRGTGPSLWEEKRPHRMLLCCSCRWRR
mmetsp:Transcript_2986/g.7880  ORF Transcript_2986/g.7880 Transcript_2986/m.7880 type:complete len:284 (+) Transcript_2986:485-1336(+)